MRKKKFRKKSKSRTSLFCTSILTGSLLLQHHLKMFIYITLPLCDLNNSPWGLWCVGKPVIWINQKHATLTTSGLALLLFSDWICSWEQANPTCVYCKCGCKKLITDRLREIRYARQPVVVKHLGKSSLCDFVSLKRARREQMSNNLNDIDVIKWNTEQQRSPLQK